MYVNEIMTIQPKTCHSSSSLDEVAHLMWEGDCGAIPIVGDDNKPVGFVTDRDIAMAAMFKGLPLRQIQVADVIQDQSRIAATSSMQSNPVCG